MTEPGLRGNVFWLVGVKPSLARISRRLVLSRGHCVPFVLRLYFYGNSFLFKVCNTTQWREKSLDRFFFSRKKVVRINFAQVMVRKNMRWLCSEQIQLSLLRCCRYTSHFVRSDLDGYERYKFNLTRFYGASVWSLLHVFYSKTVEVLLIL